MKHLIAEFTAKPEHGARVAELLAALTPAVRSEPGNVVFEPFTRAERPLSFVVVEAYADDHAFEAHLGSDHCRDFNSHLSGLIEEPASELTWLTPCCG